MVLNMTVFLDVTQYSLKNGCHTFGRTCVHRPSALKKYTVGFSKTLTPLRKSIWRHPPGEGKTNFCNFLQNGIVPILSANFPIYVIGIFYITHNVN
jgi:hypothetical protein